MAPVLEGLHRAGARANTDQAERLNALGMPSEHGRPWAVQTVAAIKYRLRCLGARPCRCSTPPGGSGADPMRAAQKKSAPTP